MSAVVYRLRSTFLRRWPGALALILVIGVVVGVVLACAAGARRTMTAPDRFTAAAGGDFDAVVTQQDGGAPLTGDVRALDVVESVEAITFVFGALIGPGPATGVEPMPVEAIVFTGTVDGGRNRLVEGRAADPAVAGEFVATRSFVDSSGSEIGDTFHLVTLTQQQADENGFSVADPDGPEIDATLVGIVDGVSEVEDFTPLAILSTALLELPDVGLSQTVMSVRLRSGVDAAGLREALDTLPGSRSLGVGSGDIVGEGIRNAVRTQAIAMWALTLVAGLAAVVVLGQLVTRFARVSEDDRARLIQIGFTDGKVLAEAMGRAGVVTVAGTVFAILWAVVPSGVFPTGLARRLEPDPGAYVDPLVLGLGALVTLVALLSWSVVAVWPSRYGVRPQATPSQIESLASRSPSATASTGLRFAFGRSGPGRSNARGQVVAVATTVALLVGAFVFGSSLNRLLDEPPRYGIKHDIAIGDDGAQSLPRELIDKVSADPDVESLVVYATNHARRGQLDVQLLGMELVRGDGAPTLTSGRLPSASDEIAFGRNSARDLGVSVGDAVELDGAAGTRTLRVSGIAVVPGFGANEGMGDGGVLTMDGLLMLDADAAPNVLAVQFGDAAPASAPDRLAKLAGGQPDDGHFRPAVIVNVARVRNIPSVLVTLIGFLCVLTVVSVVVGSVRNRHREFAIVRALGANGRWVSAVVVWQTTLLSLLPATAGAVFGFVLGRQVFSAFANSMGAIPDATLPAPMFVAATVVLVVLANIATAIAARRFRRTAPALSLRAE